MRAAFAGVILWTLFAIGVAQAEARFPVEIDARPIAGFAIGSQQTQFGALEFVGGFEIRTQNPAFGQLSALRFLSPGETFLGVADHGYWFSGRIERDAHAVPTGIADFFMQPMVDAQGRVIIGKHLNDAEGLDLSGTIATVTFEREARLCEFALEPENMAGPLRCRDILIPRHELRHNRGLETVAHAPADSPLAGARVIVAERSIDENGALFAAIIEGPHKGIFKVRRTNDYDVTDGVFLPDGNLVLLERRFSLVTGVGMRLRRIDTATIRPGALVDGEILMEADLSHRIDNMEGVDAWQREDGATILSLISDDNQSFLQKTLYLEFRLLP